MVMEYSIGKFRCSGRLERALIDAGGEVFRYGSGMSSLYIITEGSPRQRLNAKVVETEGKKGVTVSFNDLYGPVVGVWVPKWDIPAWDCCQVIKEGELEKGVRGAVVAITAPRSILERKPVTVTVQINYN